jgi:hypothetical protein
MLHEHWDQAEDSIPPMITQDEEDLGAYATKSKAVQMAKSATQNTGRWHKPVLTHTWRYGQKKTCWTVVCGS